MKLSGNKSLKLSEHKTENCEPINMVSKRSMFPNRSLGLGLLGKLEFISDLLINDKKCKTYFNTCGHTMLGCLNTFPTFISL